MIPAISKFQELVFYESERDRTVHNTPRVSKLARREALAIINGNKLVPCGVHRFEYVSLLSGTVIVNTIEKKCSCSRFLDKSLCKHLIAGCLFDGVELYGIKKQTETLRTLRRKRKRSLLHSDNEQVEDDVGQEEPVPDQDEHMNSEQESDEREMHDQDIHDPVHELPPPPPPQSPVLKEKRKRGRPPKAESALVKESTEEEVIGIRRSQRVRKV
jgi:hypothetical protein